MGILTLIEPSRRPRWRRIRHALRFVPPVLLSMALWLALIVGVWSLVNAL